MANENKDNYGPNETRDEYYYYKYLSYAAWQYVPASEMRGVPTLGKLTYYGGGGFVATLDNNEKITFDIIEELKNNTWIDRHTRAIFLEFTIYNPNVNLFSFVSLLIETSTTGGVIKFPTIQVMKAYSMDWTGILFGVSLFFLFLYFIGYIVITIQTIWKERMGYLKKANNYLSITILISICVIFIGLILRHVTLAKVLDMMNQNKNEYTQFRLVMTYDDTYKYAVAVLNAAAILKGVFSLKLNNRIAKLFATIKYASQFLGPYGIVLIVMFIAYSSVFYLTFMYYMNSFSTFIKSSETLIGIALGVFDTPAMIEASYLGTVLFFMSYSVFVSIIMMNILIISLLDAHHAVEASKELQSSDTELVDILFDMVFKGTERMATAKDFI